MGLNFKPFDTFDRVINVKDFDNRKKYYYKLVENWVSLNKDYSILILTNDNLSINKIFKHMLEDYKFIIRGYMLLNSINIRRSEYALNIKVINKLDYNTIGCRLNKVIYDYEIEEGNVLSIDEEGLNNYVLPCLSSVNNNDGIDLLYSYRQVKEKKEDDLLRLELSYINDICDKHVIGTYQMGIIIPKIYHILTNYNQEKVFDYIGEVADLTGCDIDTIINNTLEKFSKQ